MKPQMENPAARAGANRVPDIKALGGVDVQEPTFSSPEIQAVQRIASRFRLSIHHARTVCELAGIGGAA